MELEEAIKRVHLIEETAKTVDAEAIRAVLAALEWRPIAEAPKDGTKVLLFVPGRGGSIFHAMHMSDWEHGHGEWIDTEDCIVEGATHFRPVGPLPEVTP